MKAHHGLVFFAINSIVSQLLLQLTYSLAAFWLISLLVVIVPNTNAIASELFGFTPFM